MLRKNKPAAPSPAPGLDGPARVLVVNEDPDACELLCRILTAAGYVVDRSHDSTDALTRITSTHPDCVLLDLGTGGIGTNLKLLDSVRNHRDPLTAATRVVLATTQPHNRIFSWQAGVDAFLLRPFHAKDLLRDVAEMLERPESERGRYRRRRLEEARAHGRGVDPQAWSPQRY